MMNRDLMKLILVAAGLAIGIVCIITGITLTFRTIFNPRQPFPTPIITKIAVPTPTTSIINPGLIEPTTTDDTDRSGISIGSFVQISGTGGVGLRIRLEPGKESPPQFIAMENEVFEIKDGPILSDDITWWLLVAPYDINRKGWAAGQYLTIIKSPQ
jgi:hypothetical protein